MFRPRLSLSVLLEWSFWINLCVGFRNQPESTRRMVSQGNFTCTIYAQESYFSTVHLSSPLYHNIPNSPADRCKNCGIYGNSTKFGIKIENYLLNNISYGPTWDLSHNCNCNGYYTPNMEARLGKLFNYFQQIETMYKEKLTCLANTK